MGSKSKSSTSSTTNITTTTENKNAIASDNGLAVVADEFQGDIGITGQNALDIAQEFAALERDRELLFAQREANQLRAFGSVSSRPAPVFSVSGTTSAGAATNTKKAAEKTATNLETGTLILGGVAAVATIIALTK